MTELYVSLVIYIVIAIALYTGVVRRQLQLGERGWTWGIVTALCFVCLVWPLALMTYAFDKNK